MLKWNYYKSVSVVTILLITMLIACTKNNVQQSKSIQSPGIKDIDKIEDNDFSQALGFFNFGNTCFANAAHVLMSKHPKILPFLKDKTLVHENSQILLRDSFYALFLEREFRFLQYKTSQTLPSKDLGFRNELEDLIDRYRRYLREQNIDRLNFEQQFDAAEYLQTTFEALNSDGYFNIPDRAIYAIPLEGAPEIRNQYPGPHVPPAYLLMDLNEQPLKSVSEILRHHFLPNTNGAGTQEREILISASPTNTPPSQFIVPLSRFRYQDNRPVKLSHSVEINPSIQIEIYPLGTTAQQITEGLKGTPVSFHPVAVIVKDGVPEGGHYRAYTYDEGTQLWTHHNDQHVTVMRGIQEKAKAKTDMEKNGTVVLYVRDGIKSN